MVTWTEGLWRTYECKLGVFTIRVQQGDGGLWKSDVAGMTAKARWPTLDEAKIGAVKVWGDMFAAAAKAAGST